MCRPDRLTLQFQEMVSQGTSGHPSPGTVSVSAYRAEAVCLEKCIGVNFCLWTGLVRPPCIEPPLHNNSSTVFSSHPLTLSPVMHFQGGLMSSSTQIQPRTT